MRTIEELEEKLLIELKLIFRDKKNLNSELYYNEFSGNTSVYFTSLLYEKLYENENWDKNIWLDDSLLTKVTFVDDKYCVWAVVISGKQGTTQQWTDPAYFEVIPNHDSSKYNEYTFLFGDKYINSLDYKEYSKNRTFWDRDFYKDSSWNPAERDWDFIINVKNE